MLKSIAKVFISVMLVVSLFVCSCACDKKTEEVTTDDFWYGCSSFSVLAVAGYDQSVCASMYSDGYYYLSVYGQKTDEKIEGPDTYYKLYKVDSAGKGISEVSIPVQCANSCNQVVVNDKLYCIEPVSNTEFVIDAISGRIISEDKTKDTVEGYYSIEDGFVKMTRDSLIRYTKDGTENGRVNIGDINNVISFYQKDGRYYIVENNRQMTFYELNFDNDQVKKVLESKDIDFDSFVLREGIFFSDFGVYYMDIKNKALTPITEWNYVDVKPANKTTRLEYDTSYGNGRFGKIYEYSDCEIELIIFNNIPSEKRSELETITVGGYGVTYSLAIKWAVYEFNTSQDKYRIFLDEYWNKYPYSTGVEAQPQIAKLIKSFNEGNAPDIYYGTNFDYRYMYNAGLVTDMLPLMKKDPEFDINDMVPSVKNAITRNGACYQIFAAFNFDGDFGLKSVFEDKDVTYKMVDEIAKKKGISVRGDMPAAEFADQILRYSLEDLTDRSSGNHIVSEEELRGVIDYSMRNGIPYGSYSNYIADFDTVKDGTYLTCRRTYLGNLYDLAAIENTLKDSFVYLGFPSIYGAVHAAQPDGLVAISSDTKNPEVCWQFVKCMLSDAVQQVEIGEGNNPVINDVLEKYCQYAVNPKSVPENEAVWKSIVRDRKAVPDWIISDYRAMINSVDSVISYDWGLYNIICDEIDSYYIQGKSEDEIAKTLQSRIDLYVAENYK